MAVLEHIERHKLNDDDKADFKKEIAVAASHFVDTLMEAWKNVKSKTHRERLVVMKKLHNAKLEVVFDKKALEEAFQHLDDPSEAQASIYVLCAANSLGKAMWSEILQSVLSAKVSAQISKGVQDKLAGANLDSKLWLDTCRELVEEAGKVDPDRLLRPRRAATVLYRGCKIVVRVTSFLQEVEFWLAAKLKEKAVLDKDLAILLNLFSLNFRF